MRGRDITWNKQEHTFQTLSYSLCRYGHFWTEHYDYFIDKISNYWDRNIIHIIKWLLATITIHTTVHQNDTNYIHVYFVPNISCT